MERLVGLCVKALAGLKMVQAQQAKCVMAAVLDQGFLQSFIHMHRGTVIQHATGM